MPRRKVPHVSNLVYFRTHFLEARMPEGVICRARLRRVGNGE
jgi:hypothetical protein